MSFGDGRRSSEYVPVWPDGSVFSKGSFLTAVEQVPQLLALRPQIIRRRFHRLRDRRNSLRHLNPGFLQSLDLFRIVGHQPNSFKPEMADYRCRRFITTQIRLESELF